MASDVLLLGVLIIGAGLLSVPLHEGAHWFVARWWSSEIALARDGSTPNIQLNAPYELPTWGVRLMGIAPLVVGTLLLAASIFVFDLLQLSIRGVFAFLLGVFTALPSFASGGDILAVVNPRQFQKFATTTESEAPSLRDALSRL